MSNISIDNKKSMIEKQQNIIEKHAGVLGLCALIESVPYDITGNIYLDLYKLKLLKIGYHLF